MDALTLREVTAGEVAPLLAPAARYATTDETLSGLTAMGRCFAIEADGRPVAGYVLQRQGAECFVLAFAGAAELDLTVLLAKLIEAQAAGMDSIAFQTRRPGLVRKARALGYRVEGRVPNGHGVIMRKNLK